MHATLCDYLTDSVQNAVEAQASSIDIEMIENPQEISVTVTDDGKGMDADRLARVWDPFYSEPGKHHRRRVGLGLPLLRQAVETTGGELSLASQPGKGTRLQFTLRPGHPDAPPLGDLPLAVLSWMGLDGACEMTFRRRRGPRGYDVVRSELLEALGDLTEAGSLALARRYFKALEEEVLETIDLQPKVEDAASETGPKVETT